MGLLRIQEELACILLEPATRKAFRDDPASLLRSRGVGGRDLALLARLVPEDLAYFAERRNVDRHHALRADAPRSVALLESSHGRLSAYFRVHPFSLEDPRRETERFARWCSQAARDGLVPPVLPDLARFEAVVLRLLGAATPRQPVTVTRPTRARGLRMLRLGHRLGPALRAGRPEAAEPGPAWMALRRTPDDVRWNGLTAAEAWLLRAADGRRTMTQLAREALVAGHPASAVRKASRELSTQGLLRLP